MVEPEKFFKFVDNLEATVGKKGIIHPGETGTPEQFQEYYTALGKPASADDYDFIPIEPYKDAEIDPVKAKAMKELLHNANVPKDMATKLQQGFDTWIYEQDQLMKEANEKQDAEFNKQVGEMFGENRDAALASSKKLLSENASPAVLAKLETLDNDALLVMAASLDGIVKKYIKEDGFTGGDPAGGPSGESYEDLSAKQRELMKDPAFGDFRHADHQKIMAENAAIMEKMRNISK